MTLITAEALGGSPPRGERGQETRRDWQVLRPLQTTAISYKRPSPSRGPRGFGGHGAGPRPFGVGPLGHLLQAVLSLCKEQKGFFPPSGNVDVSQRRAAEVFDQMLLKLGKG